MRSYRNLYKKLYSLENLKLAFEKASKNKSHKKYVIEFELNLEEELNKLKQELETFTYKPKKLKKFIIRDPKTRKIHISAFRDRVVHHALINIIGPIFENIFIYDSFASRLNKGTLNAVLRFQNFMRKVSTNGKLVKNPFNNNLVEGYVLKADIKHYFETVSHKILIEIIRRKIRDEKVIWLINQILNNFDSEIPNVGMPLGNYTSQFFANVYLNCLDYFVKHKLKAKYYIRYVDDFVIVHKDKKVLEEYKDKIIKYLTNLELELHPDKSQIIPLRNGISFLGYRIFFHYILLRKRNERKFLKKFNNYLEYYKDEIVSEGEFVNLLRGWFGYSLWANTYKFRKSLINQVSKIKEFSERYKGKFKRYL